MPDRTLPLPIALIARRSLVATLVGAVLAGAPAAWAAGAGPKIASEPGDTIAKVDTVRRASPTPIGDPHRFFVTQFRSEFNSAERPGHNGNCGPCCVLMAAMAFGKVKAAPATVSKALQTTRVASTGRMNPDEATSVPQLTKGVQHYGLAATSLLNGSFAALKAHVQAGGLAICCVRPGLFDPSYHSVGHYVLVTAIDEAGVHISDPGRALVYGGIRVVPTAAFTKAWQVNDAEATLISAPVVDDRSSSRT